MTEEKEKKDSWLDSLAIFKKFHPVAFALAFAVRLKIEWQRHSH